MVAGRRYWNILQVFFKVKSEPHLANYSHSCKQENKQSFQAENEAPISAVSDLSHILKIPKPMKESEWVNNSVQLQNYVVLIYFALKDKNSWRVDVVGPQQIYCQDLLFEAFVHAV